MSVIGVFDSGVGGLTVLKELALHFPNSHFIYVGDTARLPYGTKSPEAIRSYSAQILNYLKSQNVDALVIACNTASSQVTEKEWLNIPVFNVIDPGSHLAVKTSNTGKIGILGTRALVASQAYPKKIHQLKETTEVFQQACPLFVPLAEEGWTDDPITNLIAYRYVQPLMMEKIDTLVLGCTHYPLLKTAIQKVTGSSVTLIDSGKAIALEIDQYFQDHKISTGTSQGYIDIFVTDLSPHTKDLAEKILSPLAIREFRFLSL